jgi:hypothetical protein
MKHFYYACQQCHIFIVSQESDTPEDSIPCEFCYGTETRRVDIKDCDRETRIQLLNTAISNQWNYKNLRNAARTVNAKAVVFYTLPCMDCNEPVKYYTDSPETFTGIVGHMNCKK